MWWERGRGLRRSSRECSAAAVFPDHRKKRWPGSCHLSVTQLLTPQRFRLVRDLARQLPAPPPADGQAGRAGRCRADPPSCQFTGAAPAGGRTLARCLVACSRALPLAACGEFRAAPVATATASSRPPPRSPLQAKFLPRAHPRVVIGPAGSGEPPRRAGVLKPC